VIDITKTTLITGASSGIGLELAKLFAEEKNELVLVARNKIKLEALKKELDKVTKVTLIIADLSEKNSPEKIKEALDKNKIEVHTLINNAGFGDYGDFKDTELKRSEEMIQVNITSLTKLTRLFIQDIIKQNGRIMNVASVAAFIPGPNMAVYYATKAYVLSFTEALAEELRNTNVKVSALCPGPTKTNFKKSANVGSDKMFRGNIPSARDAAEYGYRMLNKGKVVAIHGFANQTMMKAIKFLPRRTVTKLVRKMTD